MTARDIIDSAMRGLFHLEPIEKMNWERDEDAINTDLLLLYGIGLDTPLKADDEQA